ncbi:hypothetical protein Vadar_008860 [Vaccinium darrowii]|uniref:Uncharacterized protein n=1 Tax=Vaccinium darrowii TaxID=229202 RepID=A0ACB7XZ98_9ERIC|nr:hypothetical protein Vadar_008860 [Vaccinium darrowii]
MEKEKLQPDKWESKVSTSLTHATADQIWPLFKDFFNLHKWFPTLPTCYGIHGTNGEVGCIRYCAGFKLPSVDGVNSSVGWSTERLIAIDPVDRIITYEIVDCNTGFKSYVSTVRIVPREDDQGCIIEWSFSVEPVEGWVLEDLVKAYENGLQGMAKNMEDGMEY